MGLHDFQSEPEKLGLRNTNRAQGKTFSPGALIFLEAI